MIRAIVSALMLYSAASYAQSAAPTICRISENLTCGPDTPIKKLGVLSNGYEVYSYIHTFGESIRAAKRLIFLSGSGEYLGMYAVPELPESIKGLCVEFPTPVQEGNEVCVGQAGLPANILVGGENLVLFQ